MRNQNLKGTLQLLLAAFIWGSAFVAQSEGMKFVGPLTFLSVRFFIGGFVLIPILIFKNSLTKRKAEYSDGKSFDLKYTLVGGVFCGILLTVASGFQQFGIVHTTVSKAGFITTLYVIFVPLCSIFLRKRVGLSVWLSVILATAGLYLLCMTESLSLSLGDTLVFMCAIAYTAQILAVDHFVKKIDAVLLSCVQFLTVGVVSFIPAIVFEQPSFTAIVSAWLPILYAGILSSGVAFTLQVVAQRYTEPTIASITMSFESVFAALCGWALLNESLTLREGLGCAIMFCAIILAQLPKEWFYIHKKQ